MRMRSGEKSEGIWSREGRNMRRMWGWKEKQKEEGMNEWVGRGGETEGRMK